MASRRAAKVILIFWAALSLQCASRVLQVDEESKEKLKENKEYEEVVEIKTLPPEAQAPETPPIPKAPTAVKAQPKSKMRKEELKKREPEIEDSEGFNGRRPVADPFRADERVVIGLSYLGMSAGEMVLETLPLKEVNGRKSYHFRLQIKTSSFFSRIYSVEDSAETYLDHETLLPSTLQVHIKETKVLSESRTFFDFEKKKATFWQTSITKKKGEKKKNKSWDLIPFSQNTISALFYVRAFQLKPGKKFQIRVADEGKNIIFKGEILGQEFIDTKAGRLDVVKMRPQFEVDGTFKPMGDTFFWFTNDERKLLVKVAAKLKFGSIQGAATSLK